MAVFIYPQQQVSIPGVATEATLLLVEQNTADTVSELQTANTSLDSLETLVLTDTQLRAAPVPVSAASLPLPTGAATSLLQSDGNASLASIDSKFNIPLEITRSDTEIVGSITGTQSVYAGIDYFSSAGIDIRGTWTGTITIEGSVDGNSYRPLSCAVLNSGLISTNFSANNALQTNVSGLAFLRVIGNTITSGTATITIRLSATTGGVVLSAA